MSSVSTRNEGKKVHRQREEGVDCREEYEEKGKALAYKALRLATNLQRLGGLRTDSPSEPLEGITLPTPWF